MIAIIFKMARAAIFFNLNIEISVVTIGTSKILFNNHIPKQFSNVVLVLLARMNKFALPFVAFRILIP